MEDVLLSQESSTVKVISLTVEGSTREFLGAIPIFIARSFLRKKTACPEVWERVKISCRWCSTQVKINDHWVKARTGAPKDFFAMFEVDSEDLSYNKTSLLTCAKEFSQLREREIIGSSAPKIIISSRL